MAAQASRGSTIFWRQQQIEEQLGKENDVRAETPGFSDREPGPRAVTSQVGGGGEARRGGMIFRTGAGPREQAYQTELEKPEVHMERPAEARGWKRYLGKALAQTAGFHNIGQEMVYGDLPKAREEHGYAVAERGRKLAHQGAGVALERQGQAAENLAAYRTTNLNQQFARIKQGEEMIPERKNLMRSQAERNRKYADRADPTRAPFATLNPGQGNYNRVTGQPGPIKPDPAAARQTHYPPSGGGVTPLQLSNLEKDKEQELKTAENSFQIAVRKIVIENDRLPPSMNRSKEQKEVLSKQHNDTLNRIQRSYEERRKLLGNPVDHYEYPQPGTEEGGTQSEDLGAAAQADDERDAAENQAGAATGDEDLPIGTIMRDPETGEGMMWNGEGWEPVEAAPGR
jgi:hypothetical protein